MAGSHELFVRYVAGAQTSYGREASLGQVDHRVRHHRSSGIADSLADLASCWLEDVTHRVFQARVVKLLMDGRLLMRRAERECRSVIEAGDDWCGGLRR